MDRFLIDYKVRFLEQSVEIGLKSGTTWTGKLSGVDESGAWLTEAIDAGTRATFIPWDVIESTTTPPLPEDQE